MEIKDAICKYLLASTPISGLVGTRVFHGYVPQGTASPYIHVRRASELPDKSMSGGTGLTKSRFHILAVALNDTLAAQVASAVFNRCHGFNSQRAGSPMGGEGGVPVQSMFETNRFDEFFPNPENESLRLIADVVEFELYYPIPIPDLN